MPSSYYIPYGSMPFLEMKSRDKSVQTFEKMMYLLVISIKQILCYKLCTPLLSLLPVAKVMENITLKNSYHFSWCR